MGEGGREGVREGESGHRRIRGEDGGGGEGGLPHRGRVGRAGEGGAQIWGLPASLRLGAALGGHTGGNGGGS